MFVKCYSPMCNNEALLDFEGLKVCKAHYIRLYQRRLKKERKEREKNG